MVREGVLEVLLNGDHDGGGCVHERHELGQADVVIAERVVL